MQTSHGRASSHIDKKSKENQAAMAKAKITVGDKPYSKAQLVTTLAEMTGLTKTNVTDVLNSMNEIAAAHLKKRGGPEAFVIPGVVKLQVRKTPARKARMGRNPKTGEEMKIAAQPAKKTVRARVLAGAKAMIA